MEQVDFPFVAWHIYTITCRKDSILFTIYFSYLWKIFDLQTANRYDSHSGFSKNFHFSDFPSVKARHLIRLILAFECF